MRISNLYISCLNILLIHNPIIKYVYLNYKYPVYVLLDINSFPMYNLFIHIFYNEKKHLFYP